MATRLEDWLPAFAAAGSDLRGSGLVSSHGGNLSVWAPDGVVITRLNAPLGRLTAADLSLVSRTTQAAGEPPALDTPIHRAVYIMTQGRAVIGAQPQHAGALALLEDVLLPVDVGGRMLLGKVTVLRHTRDIVREVGEALAERPVVLVRGHGSYARGATLDEALQYTTQLEHSAQLLFLVRQLTPGAASLAGRRPAE